MRLKEFENFTKIRLTSINCLNKISDQPLIFQFGHVLPFEIRISQR